MPDNAGKQTVIRAIGLTKTYNGVNVVDGLGMEVREGDIYGFVGRNGAGKSTTMKMICGLISASSGEIDVLGHDPANHAGLTGVGTLIEAPGLLDRMSAMDNLMYKATALGVPHAREHCQELLEIVNLADTGKKEAHDFSLGMRQRLGIALAMVGDPKVLMLDEPFNGLDPAATHEMRQTLQRMNQERGMTLIVSSHVLDQLNRFATRFGVINAGRMVVEFDAERMRDMATGPIRVKCADMAQTAQVLQSVAPGVDLPRDADGTFLIPGNSASIEDISLALWRAGLQVLELHQTERDVEEFFLELMNTSGEKTAASAPGSAKE